MIEDHDVLILPTLNGSDFEVEVNFNEDPKVKECKILRFREKSTGKTFDFKTDDLTTLLLAVGNAQVQKDLLPIKVRKVRRLERLLSGSFKAKKNYARGDTIYFNMPWVDEVPIDNLVLSGNLQINKKNTKKHAKFLT
jgi:hypothetical protein